MRKDALIPRVVEARTATVAGDGTGVISESATHVVVTSANAVHIVTLPAPTVGKQIVIDVGANGFKLVSTSPTTIAINGGVATTGVASSTIAANSTIIAICISATAWKAIFLDADSDVAKVTAATT